MSPATKIDIQRSVFQNVIGQGAACEILLSALENKRVPHAYLFAGPPGVGKKTTALQWAKVLNCSRPISSVEACEACSSCKKISAKSHPDVMWINYGYQAALLKEDLAKQRALKIGTLREMERALQLKPLEGRVKIAFIEPAEKMLDAAAHALLKILEEPPADTHIVLIASDASQLLGTLRSRCQWIRFRPLPVNVLVPFLQGRGFAEEHAREAAVQAEGSIQRALEILDKTEELSFDWETAPLSELLTWCDQFQNPRLGRAGAEDFLRRLLSRFQTEMYGGDRNAEDVERVLNALHQLKRFVTPSLVLQVLLLKFRWDRKHQNRK